MTGRWDKGLVVHRALGGTQILQGTELPPQRAAGRGRRDLGVWGGGGGAHHHQRVRIRSRRLEHPDLPIRMQGCNGRCRRDGDREIRPAGFPKRNLVMDAIEDRERSDPQPP